MRYPTILAAAALIGCCWTTPLLAATPTQQPTAAQAVAQADNLTVLTRLLTATDLLPVVQALPAATILAPSDSAFATLPAGTVQSLLQPEQRETLKTILLNHVLAGALPADQLISQTTARTKAGSPLAITVLKSTNPTMVANKVFINEAEVTAADVAISNGIVHVIDAVLLPSDDRQSRAPATTTPPTNQAPAPLATLLGDQRFSTLRQLLDTTELTSVLINNARGGTIFAPTNSAFSRLPSATVAALQQPAQRQALTQLLSRHVLGQRLDADHLRQGDRLHTLVPGDQIQVAARDGTITVDGAGVLSSSIAGPYIVHVVDRVLLPTVKHIRAHQGGGCRH